MQKKRLNDGNRYNGVLNSANSSDMFRQFIDHGGRRYTLYAWDEEVSELSYAIDALCEEWDDIKDSESQIRYLKQAKPDFVYWLHSGNEVLDIEEIADLLKEKYPDWYIDFTIEWRDSAGADIGFVQMYRKKPRQYML